MISTNLDFSGLNELSRDLELLSKAESRQVLRKSVRAGADVIKEEIDNTAPELTGKLKKNIVVIFGKGASGSVVAGIHIRGRNPKTGNSDNTMKTDSPNNAFYWRFLEEGTSKMSAHPFIRPAFDSKQDEAASAAFDEMAKAFDEAISK